MQETTEIPPHVAHLHHIKTAASCCKDIKDVVLDFKADLNDSVFQAIDKKVQESWGINVAILDSDLIWQKLHQGGGGQTWGTRG